MHLCLSLHIYKIYICVLEMTMAFFPNNQSSKGVIKGTEFKVKLPLTLGQLLIC